MRSNEQGFLTDPEDILKYLKKITNLSIVQLESHIQNIHDNGVIDYNGDFITASAPGASTGVMTVKESMTKFIELKVQFGHVTGVFDLACTPIESIKGFPRSCGVINLRETKIKNLIGIHDQCDFESLVLEDCSELTELNIGLLLVPRLNTIFINDYASGTKGKMKKSAYIPLSIIAKYAGKQEEIYDCQMELIEAGYGKFAEL